MPCKTCEYYLIDKNGKKVCVHPDGFEPDVALSRCMNEKTESKTVNDAGK